MPLCEFVEVIDLCKISYYMLPLLVQHIIAIVDDTDMKIVHSLVGDSEHEPVLMIVQPSEMSCPFFRREFVIHLLNTTPLFVSQFNDVLAFRQRREIVGTHELRCICQYLPVNHIP